MKEVPMPTLTEQEIRLVQQAKDDLLELVMPLVNYDPHLAVGALSAAAASAAAFAGVSDYIQLAIYHFEAAKKQNDLMDLHDAVDEAQADVGQTVKKPEGVN